MALADHIQNRNTGGLPCSLGQLLEQLDGAELDALRLMLGTPEQRGWTAGDIHAALLAEGHTGVAYRSINHHRGGKCRCSRVAA